jgi:hypothetical protein
MEGRGSGSFSLIWDIIHYLSINVKSDVVNLHNLADTKHVSVGGWDRGWLRFSGGVSQGGF